MRILPAFLLTLLISACLESVASPDLNGSESEDTNTEILKELKRIRAILQRMEQRDSPRPQKTASLNAKVSSKGRPALGNENAPLTLIEFSDYQCPFCKRFYHQTQDKLKKEYIDQGKLRIVYKDLPLSFHKQAYGAALAAHCAGEQGKYWEMHDMLFENNKLEEDDLLEYAKNLALDTSRYRDCVKDNRFANQIEADIAEAGAADITGTPTFVLGKTSDDMIDGVRIRGAQSFENMKAEIEKQLEMLME